MDFLDLRQELVDRGALDDPTRNGNRIDAAYRIITNAFDWPFAVKTATGVADAGEVAVADLRKVIVVGDLSQAGSGDEPGRRLDAINYEELAEDLDVDDVGQTGTAQYWWYDAAAGAIKSYPVGGTLYVRYYKRFEPLSTATTPEFDEEYHLLIVDRAMVEAYKDTDDYAMARDALQLYQTGLAGMAQDYEVFKREHSYIQVVNPYDG